MTNALFRCMRLSASERKAEAKTVMLHGETNTDSGIIEIQDFLSEIHFRLY